MLRNSPTFIRLFRTLPPQSGCVNVDADLDEDGDVDGNDFLTFSLCFNGSLNPPGCCD